MTVADARVFFDPTPVLSLFPPGTPTVEVARRTGVSRSTVDNWRRGDRRLQSGTADRVATRLGVHPSQLWDWDAAYDHPHGAGATQGTWRRCGCDDCRAARSRHDAARRRQRHEQMLRGEVNPPHGEANTYLQYECRCDPCKAAQSSKYKTYWAARAAAGEQTPEGPLGAAT